MTRNIKNLPECERPREKLLQKGPQALSDLELMAVILGRGTKGHDVMKVAEDILKVLDSNPKPLSIEELQKIYGVGPAKATLISATLEFSRRRIRPEGLKISTPAEILPLIQHYGDRKQEHFLCISINGANEVIKSRVVSVGFINKTQVHPREVFADPITDRASAIVVAHNHPDGTLSPSEEDKEITRQLKSVGETMGIRLLDHIIFNQKGYYSFLEKGDL